MALTPFALLSFASARYQIGRRGATCGLLQKGSRPGGGKKPNPRDQSFIASMVSFTRTGTLAMTMTRNIFANAACFFLLSIAPVAALPSSHVVPAPEADAGLLALVMVGGVAFLTYWRKGRS